MIIMPALYQGGNSRNWRCTVVSTVIDVEQLTDMKRHRWMAALHHEPIRNLNLCAPCNNQHKRTHGFSYVSAMEHSKL